MLLDFLTITPKKEYNHFYNEDIYIIPCRILNFGEEATHNSVWVTIEHLDFITGKPVLKRATCYKNSLRFFKEMELPFSNECSIIKSRGGLKFLIYGRFDPHMDVSDKFLGTYDVKSEEELREIFKEKYQELNSWINEPVQRP